MLGTCPWGGRGWHSWQEGSEHFWKKRLLAPATSGHLGGRRCEAWNPQLVALSVVSGGGLRSVGFCIRQLEWVSTGPGTCLCLYGAGLLKESEARVSTKRRVGGGGETPCEQGCVREHTEPG